MSKDADDDKIREWFKVGWMYVASRGRLSSHVSYLKEDTALQLSLLGSFGGRVSEDWVGTQKAIHRNRHDAPVQALRARVSEVNELEGIVDELQHTATFCFQQAGYNPDVRKLDGSFLSCGRSSKDATSIQLDLTKAVNIVSANARRASESGHSDNFNPDRIAMTQAEFLKNVSQDLREELNALKTDNPGRSEMRSALSKVELDPRKLWPPLSLLHLEARQIRSSRSRYGANVICKFVSDSRKARCPPSITSEASPRNEWIESQVLSMPKTAESRSWAEVAKPRTVGPYPIPAQQTTGNRNQETPTEDFPALPGVKAVQRRAPAPQPSSLKSGPTRRKTVSWSQPLDDMTGRPSTREQKARTPHHLGPLHDSLDLIALGHQCLWSQLSDDVESGTLGLYRTILGAADPADRDTYEAALERHAQHYRAKEIHKAQTRHHVRVALDSLGYHVKDDTTGIDNFISEVYRSSKQTEEPDIQSVIHEAIERSGHKRRRSVQSPNSRSCMTPKKGVPSEPDGLSVPQSARPWSHPSLSTSYTNHHTQKCLVNGYTNHNEEVESSLPCSDKDGVQYLQHKWPPAPNDAPWTQVIGGKKRSKGFELPRGSGTRIEQPDITVPVPSKEILHKTDAATTQNSTWLSSVEAAYPELARPLEKWADDCEEPDV